MRKRYQKGSLEKLNGIWIARWYCQLNRLEARDLLTLDRQAILFLDQSKMRIGIRADEIDRNTALTRPARPTDAMHIIHR